MGKNAPDPKFVYRTLLTLYAKQEGLKITFIDSPKENKNSTKIEKNNDEIIEKD